MITVVRTQTAEASGPAGSNFSGEAWRDTLIPRSDGIAVADVFFAPGSRSHWHTHEGGQLLFIKSGRGYVGDADGVVEVFAGDVAWTPPGVRHWHGAAEDRSMLHTAVSIRGVEWSDEVTDEEYGPKDARA